MSKKQKTDTAKNWLKNPAFHQQMFKPGQSGNPQGRPEGASNSITSRLRKALEKDDGALMDIIVRVVIEEAVKKRDFRFIKEVWDRVEGKVADKIDLENEVKVTHVMYSIDDGPERPDPRVKDRSDGDG